MPSFMRPQWKILSSWSNLELVSSMTFYRRFLGTEKWHENSKEKVVTSFQTFVNDVRIQEQMYITLKIDDKLRFGYDILFKTPAVTPCLKSEDNVRHSPLWLLLSLYLLFAFVFAYSTYSTSLNKKLFFFLNLLHIPTCSLWSEESSMSQKRL